MMKKVKERAYSFVFYLRKEYCCEMKARQGTACWISRDLCEYIQILQTPFPRQFARARLKASMSGGIRPGLPSASPATSVAFLPVPVPMQTITSSASRFPGPLGALHQARHGRRGGGLQEKPLTSAI